MENIRVEIFYGEYNPEDQYNGATFYFDSYNEALDFVSIVELNSNCNALIIQSFNFKENEGE